MKVFNFFCAILLFMKFTLSSKAAFYTSISETDSHESTSDTSRITTSESENDEVFSFSTTDDVKLLSTNDFEYVKTDNASEDKNVETLNTFISHNEKVISNCKSNIVDSLLSTSDSENLEVSTTPKFEQDDKIDKKCYLEEFRRDMIKMFLLIQKNRDFSTTKANLKSLKDIENDLNNEMNNDNESNLNCLKHYSDLIHVFLIFFDDKENDNSPEFLQKRISKVQEKLENIDEVTNMVNELYDEEGLDPLDLIKFKEEITRLKELLDEETKHYLNYIDFRRENYQNNSSLIKEKLLKFQENLKIKTNEIFFMIPMNLKIWNLFLMMIL